MQGSRANDSFECVGDVARGVLRQYDARLLLCVVRNLLHARKSLQAVACERLVGERVSLHHLLRLFYVRYVYQDIVYEKSSMSDVLIVFLLGVVCFVVP